MTTEKLPELAPGDCFLRRNEVLRRTGLSSSTMNRKMKEGAFPQSFKLFADSDSVAWLESEIEAWRAQRLQERERVE